MKQSNRIIALISEIRDKANNLIIQELEKQGIRGLAPSHGSIFNLLFHSKDQLRMMDIAKKIHKDKSTVTALINKLSKLNYVQRTKCPKDSRVTFISLTQAGKELEPVFSSVSAVLLETTFRGLNAEEQGELMVYLDKILNNF